MMHALYPNLTTVGEVYNSDPTVTSYFAGGQKHVGIDTGLATEFDFPSYFALRSALTGASGASSSMGNLEKCSAAGLVVPSSGHAGNIFRQPRYRSIPPAPGASAASERLAFGLLATMRGMPQIYYGDEIGLSSGPSGDNRADFPGGFPGDSNNGFTAAGRTPQQQAMYAWVQSLLDLRAHHEALQTGSQQNLLADETVFVFARFVGPAQKNGSTPPPSEIDLVLMNKSSSPRIFHLDFTRTALDGIAALAPLWNTKDTVAVTQDHCDVTVGAQQLVVFTAQPSAQP